MTARRRHPLVALVAAAVFPLALIGIAGVRAVWGQEASAGGEPDNAPAGRDGSVGASGLAEPNASTAQRSAKPQSTGPVLALSASGSVYQAGVTLAVLGQLRAEKKADPPSAILGVSSGGVNALVAAITWCLDGDESFHPDENPLWGLWQNVSWERLFPGDLTCSEYRKKFPELDAECTGDRPYGIGDGILTLNGFERVRKDVLRLLSAATFRKSCGPLAFAIPLLSEDPVPLKSGDFTVMSSRRYVSGSAQTDSNGHFQMCDLPLAGTLVKSDDRFTGARRMGFPLMESQAQPSGSGTCRPVATHALFEAIIASSSIPPFLEPHPLDFCGTGCEPSETPGYHCPAGQQLCRARFVDGGIFDRLPISLGFSLDQRKHPFIVLDPSPKKGSAAEKLSQGPELPTGLRGVTFYKDALAKFIQVATDYEMQTIRRYETNLELDRVLREVPVFGDYLLHYASFLDQRFARYDYYSGLYEGLRWTVKRRRLEQSEVMQGLAPDTLAEFLASYGAELGVAGATNPPDGMKLPVSISRSRALGFVILSHLQTQFCSDATVTSSPDCARVIERRDQLAKRPELFDFAHIHAVLGAQKQKTSNAGGLPVVEKDFGAVAAALGAGPHAIHNAASLDFLKRHDYWFAETQRQFAARLEVIERGEGRPVTASALATYQYAESIAAGRQRSGWVLGSGTIPERVIGRGWVATAERTIVPHTFLAEFVHGGLRVGWDLLSLRAKTGAALTLGANLNWLRHARFEPGVRFGPSLAASMLCPGAVISELGVRATWRPGWELGIERWAADIYIRPLYGRLELALGARGIADEAARDRIRNYAFVNVGLADLNGTLYWMLRGVTGDDETYHQLAGNLVGRIPGR